MIILSDRTNWAAEGHLERLAGYLGANCRRFDYADGYVVGNGQIGPVLPGRHYVSPLGNLPLDGVLVNFLNRPEIVNDIWWQGVFQQKPRTDAILANHKIAAPAFCQCRSRDDWERFTKAYHTVILKAPDRCGGAGHFIIQGDRAYAPGGRSYRFCFHPVNHWGAELAPVIDGETLHISTRSYLQEFLFSDRPEVWRAYVVGGKAMFFSVRCRSSIDDLGDLIINACRGATYGLVKVSDAAVFMPFIDSILSVMKIEVGTIDFLVYQGRPHALEIDCDGIFTFVDRDFYHCSSYHPTFFDFDRQIADWLLTTAK